jgi:hypothetical protein
MTGLLAEQNRGHQLHIEKLRLQKKNNDTTAAAVAAEGEHPQAQSSRESVAPVPTSLGNGNNREDREETEDGSCPPDSFNAIVRELLDRGSTPNEAFEFSCVQYRSRCEQNRTEAIAAIQAEGKRQAELSRHRMDILARVAEDM